MRRVVAVALLFGLPGVVSGQNSGESQPVVGAAVRQDVSPPLRELILQAGPVRPGPDREITNMLEVGQERTELPGLERDPLLEASQAPVAPRVPTPGPSSSFDGTSDDDNAAVLGVRIVPPDTNGDVGLEHYVQMNNLVFEIFDKQTGASVLGPAAGNVFWAGFGGLCEAENDGDPIVLYDHLADRWVFSQFANPAATNNGHQCFAISTTPDPTGPYFRYDFLVSPGRFNDYPKIGMWPDGYYISINEFSPGPGIFVGAAAVAVERAQMLAGAATAQMVRFAVPSSNFSLQPSHLEGVAPAAGTPSTFISHVNGLPDGYRLWNFSVNWANPAASTFVQLPFVTSPAFDTSVNFVPQAPPGENLDALAGNFTMYRAQQRQLTGVTRSIVVNHTVDVGGNRAGVRWAELRNSGANWILYQTGTQAPADGLHRWMGSIAQDRNGHIAVGYSVSGSTIAPDIRYATRSVGDPLGTLPGGEVTLHAGSGVQTASFNRWGDYSAMSTDPFPDCKFWYTQEYYANNGSFDFKTRIGSFVFPNCGPSLLLKINGDAGQRVQVPPAPGTAQVTLAMDDGDSATAMDWYWAIIANGTVSWVTSTGVSPIQAPFLVGVPPVDLPDTTIWSPALPSGANVTVVWFLLDGSALAALDFATAVVP